jgi:hypothetical protein
MATETYSVYIRAGLIRLNVGWGLAIRVNIEVSLSKSQSAF